MTRFFSRPGMCRWRSSRGSNLIEAAIVMPLVLLVGFSVAEYALIFYVNLALQHGVSQATRYAITGQVQGGMTREESIKYAMRLATPTLTIPDAAFSFEHFPPGGSGWIGGVGGPDAIEKVTVEYDWQVVTPLMQPFVANGRVHFEVVSSMKNEGQLQL